MGMALGTTPVGRPYLVADIPFNNARKVALLEEFYSVCASLSVPDMLRLSRAFAISDRAVRKWKYEKAFPRWEEAIDVIEWVRRGKPIKKVYQSEKIINMM